MSLVVSSIAVTISIFNCIMCSQNEFDPIILQIELKRRKEKHGSANNRRDFMERESLKRKIAGTTKTEITRQLTKIGRKDKPVFDRIKHI